MFQERTGTPPILSTLDVRPGAIPRTRSNRIRNHHGQTMNNSLRENHSSVITINPDPTETRRQVVSYPQITLDRIPSKKFLQ